jgi:hypothetical protein
MLEHSWPPLVHGIPVLRLSFSVSWCSAVGRSAARSYAAGIGCGALAAVWLALPNFSMLSHSTRDAPEYTACKMFTAHKQMMSSVFGQEERKEYFRDRLSDVVGSMAMEQWSM